MMHLSAYLPHIAKSKYLPALLLALGLLLSCSASGQSRTQMERQRREKEKEIKETRKRLAETGRERKKTLSYLRDLNTQIGQRQNYISTLEQQREILNNSISKQSDITAALERDLRSLKQEYAELVYFIYKNRGSYNMLAFVFASNSFNQAMKRVKFIQFYTSYRRNQMELIMETEQSLQARLTELRADFEEKETVLAQLNEEKTELEKNKNERSLVVKDLKGRESELRRQLRQQQAAARKLDKVIQDAIERELAEERRRERRGATTTAAPANIKLTADFEDNRNRLPWPLEKASVSERFGRHEHLTLEHVIVENAGLKLRCAEGSKAKAVFDGEVSMIVAIPGAGNAVIVKHGSYMSVYVHLEDIYVKKGQKVSTGQDLGTVAYSPITHEYEMELRINKNGQNLNPEQWLRKQ